MTKRRPRVRKPKQKSPQRRADEALAAGRYLDAIDLLKRILERDNANGKAYFMLGTALQKLGELEAAIKAFRLSGMLLKNEPGIPNSIGLALLGLGRPREAADCFKDALAIAPELPELYANLANACRTLGRLDEAIAAIEEARRLDPSNAELHRLYLMTLVYSPDVDNETLFEKHREFETTHAKPRYAERIRYNRDTDSVRRLRIGYVSSDFKDHPVGHNIAPLIFHHDPKAFEVFLYAHVTSRDPMVAAFEDSAHHWLNIAGFTDARLAKRIAQDRIDILVVPAGHLDHNRPLVAAYGPAPIQISYHDICTSGMRVYDYLLTDPFIHPPGHADRFTERLVRLPTFYAYNEPRCSPEIADPPCVENKGVMFGSFNNPGKMNPHVMRLWSKILLDTPNASLLLSYSSALQGEAEQNRIRKCFADNGVHRSRIVFDVGKKNRPEHLERYQRVDIALDPFPFNGATTTFEALWMGVPVITLPGDRLMSRISGSLLKAVGLTETIADCEASYLRIARDLCSDVEGLTVLRHRLRERVVDRLCNPERYARQVERLMRGMWRVRCARNRTSELQ